MGRIISIFCEGDTEEIFYKRLITYIREKGNKPFNCEIEIFNLKGIGNLAYDSYKFLDRLRTRHLNDEIIAFVCIDTDVFDFSKKPPINKDVVKENLLSHGATKVTYIEAKSSIEDWFLCDFESIAKYLRLGKDVKCPNGSGQKVLTELFKKSNKIYIKGRKSEEFIKMLDLSKIVSSNCNHLLCLFKALDIDCQIICQDKCRYKNK